MSALAVSPLGETVGAEVRGLSGADLLADDTLPAAVLAALDRHGVLVFRGIGVDDATHAAFSQRLDQVGKATPAPLPDVDTVSLDPAVSRSAEYTRGTFGWHIDGAQDEVPTKATVLSAKTLAARGGETEFASTYAVHDDLSAEERRGLAPLRVVHSFRASQRLAFPDPTPEQEARWAQKPDRVHPLVWLHRNGRRSLVIGVTADEVVGMPVEEGRALLEDLLARATRPGRVYRHEWSPGDLVVWDNTGVLHRARPYAPDSAREMHRTTMSGDEPVRDHESAHEVEPAHHRAPEHRENRSRP